MPLCFDPGIEKRAYWEKSGFDYHEIMARDAISQSDGGHSNAKGSV